MELRHLRYFVAVAEQRSFLGAARHLRVAQPALSRQIRDLEHSLGVTLFHRLPRGVALTSAGEAFLTEARRTLEAAANAITAARRAEQASNAVLHFAHGSEMGIYAPVVADLVAEYRKSQPEVEVRVSNFRQTELLTAVREHDADVAATFLMNWPEAEFEAYRVLESPLTGVLLGATHPLAGKSSLQLRELRDYMFLARSSKHWPENYRVFLTALRERGLILQSETDRSGAAPSGSVELAAGKAWTLANETIAAPFLASTKNIVFRPFRDEPIRSWLALIWLPGAPERVQCLVDIARTLWPGGDSVETSLGSEQTHGGERSSEAIVDVDHGYARRTAV